MAGGEPSKLAGSWEDSGIQRMRKSLSAKGRSKQDTGNAGPEGQGQQEGVVGETQHGNMTLSHGTRCVSGSPFIKSSPGYFSAGE